MSQSMSQVLAFANRRHDEQAKRQPAVGWT